MVYGERDPAFLFRRVPAECQLTEVTISCFITAPTKMSSFPCRAEIYILGARNEGDASFLTFRWILPAHAQKILRTGYSTT